MIHTALPDPDYAVRWKAERSAAWDRLRELERKATDGGLTDAERAEYRELDRRVAEPFAAAMFREGRA